MPRRTDPGPSRSAPSPAPSAADDSGAPSQGKVLLCRCEDVTLADVEDAIALGYLDIEEVKRYTGLGTGPCQGRECMVPTCRLLHDARARAADRAGSADRLERAGSAPIDHPFTARPPVYPAALGVLAGGRRSS